MIASPSPRSGTAIAAIRVQPARAPSASSQRSPAKSRAAASRQVAGLREVPDDRGAGQRRGAEGQQRLLRRRRRVAPSRTGSARRVVRQQHARGAQAARRLRRAGRHGPADGPDLGLDRLRRHAARAQQHGAAGRPVRSSTVDSTPTAQGPPSTTAAMRPPSPSSTCAAVVGLTWPERLAEGAATGRPTCAQQRRARADAPAPAPPACRAPRPPAGPPRQPGPARQHQGQRAGPEAGGQQPGAVVGHAPRRRPPSASG